MESEMTQKAHFRKKYDTLLEKNLAALYTNQDTAAATVSNWNQWVQSARS